MISVSVYGRLRSEGSTAAQTDRRGSTTWVSRCRRLVMVVREPCGVSPIRLTSQSGRYTAAISGALYDPKPRLPLNGGLTSEADALQSVLTLLDAHGLEGTLETLNGSLAMVVWDEELKVLHLVRDRVGKQTLFYGWIDSTFRFGSQLQDLVRYPGFGEQINRDALTLYLRHNCIPAPYTIYEGIWKLPPASVLSVRVDSQVDAMPNPQSYWSPRRQEHEISPTTWNQDEAIDYTETLLKDSIAIRFGPKPTGAFLSGGIDSALVVAVAQSMYDTPLKTYTIGFHEKIYNEAVDAKRIARHLGTDHTELYVSADRALEVIPKLPKIYQEPFSDSSQIPSFLVSQLAAGDVDVVLSGDGGDEVFGGYNRHVWVPAMWPKLKKIPVPVRRTAAKAILAVSSRTWDRMYGGLARFLPSRLHVRGPGAKLHKLATVMDSSSPEEIYLRLTSHWLSPEDVVVSGTEPPRNWCNSNLGEGNDDLSRRMMYLDLTTYLPDDCLVKVGRAAASVGLEVRSPLLDYRLIEHASILPTNLMIRDGHGKWILRQILYKYVPPELMDRPKWGFGIPLDQWLRGPLRDWAESLLDTNRLKSDGFFNPNPVRDLWLQHVSGKADWQYHLWDVLMFQSWLDTVHKGYMNEKVSQESEI